MIILWSSGTSFTVNACFMCGSCIKHISSYLMSTGFHVICDMEEDIGLIPVIYCLYTAYILVIYWSYTGHLQVCFTFYFMFIWVHVISYTENFFQKETW
jgi:hypothetical protein